MIRRARADGGYATGGYFVVATGGSKHVLIKMIPDVVVTVPLPRPA